MGQTSSSHDDSSRIKPSNFKSQLSLSKLARKRFKNSKNLSHTFSFPDESLRPQQLNLNTATEEELMTLPGINRVLAKNIVTHRRLIGRFSKIQDLALVSGIGAEKLETIKPEIYVALSNGSGVSSRASTSLDSVGNIDSQVDVNSASIFDLQVVPGVDQELASRIVEKRSKRGCYNSLDELSKLRGMGKQRFAIIKPHLKVNGYHTNGSTKKSSSNGGSPSPSINNPQASSTPRSITTQKINREKIQPIVLNNIDDDDDDDDNLDEEKNISPGITEKEIWELLSIASPRPQLECYYSTNNNNSSKRPSIRIGTWNLSGFNVDKAENHGVMEVICRTILENKLSIITLQEVKSQDALELLTIELNTPTLKRVRDWNDNDRKWKSIHLGAGLAILWNSCSKKNIIIKEQPPATTVFLPVLASIVFHVNKVDLTVVNVQMHSDDDNNIIERFVDTKNSIFLGDFSKINNTSNIVFNDVIYDDNTAFFTDKYLYKDKIIWGKGSKKIFNAGNSKIVREGLRHWGIPNGWKWGGPASNHCPLWCEIYTEPSSD